MPGLFDSFDSGFDRGLNLQYGKKERENKYQQGLSQLAMLQAEADNAPKYYAGLADNASNQAGISGVALQYAPQMTQADLGYKQAQTGLTNMQTRFTPLQYAISASNSMSQNSRFGDSYQLNQALRSMPQAARDTWIAQHPEEYTAMIDQMANKSAQQETNQNSKFLNGVLKQAFPSADLTFNPTPQQQQALVDNGIAKFSSSPEDIAKIKQAAEMSANKSLTTAATRRQNEGAIQVENIFNDPGFQSRALNASAYAGAAGKGKAALAALSQTNPKAYEDYLAFANQDMVLLENRIKTLDQMGATDSQREQLEGIWKKTADSLTSNPAQFVTQLNNLGTALNNVAKSVEKSANPLGGPSRLEGVKPIGGNSNQDLSKMTTEEIKARLAQLQGGS